MPDVRLSKGKRSAKEYICPVYALVEDDFCLVCCCRKGKRSAWCAAVGRGRGLPDVHLSEGEEVCLMSTCRKGKKSAWSVVVEV